MNQYSIIGNLTKDAEIKTIGQKTFNSFTVAVNDGKDKDGNNIVFFIQVMSPVNGEVNGIIPYLTKGTKILVQGRPQFKAWTKQDGCAQADVTIWSTYVELLSSKQDGTEQQSRPITAQDVINGQKEDVLPF